MPAAGPFLGSLLRFSEVVISGVVFVRLPKRPNRGFDVCMLGLGVRVLVPLVEGCSRGLKSGTIPRPVGAGVASRGDVNTGLGDGFLDGKREP